MEDAPPLTPHAMVRVNARGVPQEAIEAALDWGRSYPSHGSIVYRLDRRSVAEAAEAGVRLEQHEGVVVVATRDGAILTAYRNRSPRRIKR